MGNYTYEILWVLRQDGAQSFRGYVYAPNKETRWFESDSFDSLRLQLITIGQQGLS